jgi:hypothetical protein
MARYVASSLEAVAPHAIARWRFLRSVHGPATLAQLFGGIATQVSRVQSLQRNADVAGSAPNLGTCTTKLVKPPQYSQNVWGISIIGLRPAAGASSSQSLTPVDGR